MEIRTFNGNFKTSDLFVISPNYEGDLVIYGNIKLKADVEFKGGIFVMGNILINGSVEAEIICASGYIEADDIRAQDVICDGPILCENIIVAGDLKCKTIEAGNIYVYNDFICDKKVYLHGNAFDVGGNFSCSEYVGNVIIDR